HIGSACDEIWSLEVVGSEPNCLLLWSRALDKVTGKNPFRDRDLSLGQLSMPQPLNIRTWTWQMFRLPQLGSQPERQTALNLLHKGLDALGDLDTQDEQQLDSLLHLLHTQSLAAFPSLKHL